MQHRGLLGELIQSLCYLPGVGPKSAQRMAFYLLERNRTGARQLVKSLQDSLDNIGHCEMCRTLSEENKCHTCSSLSRDPSLLCIVESPSDVWIVDQATVFKGLFFVLHGSLSPLDGIGPEDLGLDLLDTRLSQGTVKEVILANNATVEGEATAHYIAQIASNQNVIATRLAHGVPMGSELEYIDSGTLSHAFSGRKSL